MSQEPYNGRRRKLDRYVGIAQAITRDPVHLSIPPSPHRSWVMLMAYSAEQRTSGRVPMVVADMLCGGPAHVRDLVVTGLAHWQDDPDTGERVGVILPSYVDTNWTDLEAQAYTADKRRAAETRWNAARDRP